MAVPYTVCANKWTPFYVYIISANIRFFLSSSPLFCATCVCCWVCFSIEYWYLWAVCTILCECTYCIAGIKQILPIKTSRRYFSSRLTPDMENKLNFLTSRVRFGQQKRYQEWFQRQASWFVLFKKKCFLVVTVVRFSGMLTHFHVLWCLTMLYNSFAMLVK